VRVTGRRSLVVPLLLLILSPGLSVALAQQATAQDESRLVEWAARLDAADRPDEALSVLGGLLDERPTSGPGLALLLQIAARRERVAPFLPRFERAGGDEAASEELRRLWVDALLAAGLADSARSVAAGWAEARPTEAAAYVAWATAEVASGDPEAGAEALRRGRQKLGSRSAFAVELGTLSLEMGDYRAAADEWVRLTQTAGDPTLLEEVVGGDDDVRGAFVDAVAAAARGAPTDATVAASHLMLRFGAPERAGELARGLEKRLPPPERREFLARFAEGARVSGANDQGAWAAERLADLIDDPVRRDRWRAAAADMALQAGDSARARRAFNQLLRSVARGTDVHRVSARRLFSLSLSEMDQAELMLADYQRTYPQPESELIEMRIELTRSFIRADRLPDAARVLATGPSIASTGDVVPHGRLALELGHVRLYAGDGVGAIRALENAASATDSDVRTRTSAIRLAGALASSDSATATRLGQLLYLIARGPTPAELETGLREWESGETSPEGMALAASGLDEAGFSSQAAALRERLIERYPVAPESAVALLAIARYERALQPLDKGSSPVSRLERLILEYPQSAVTPLARRLRAEWLATSPSEAGGG
jgi:tetratricopeptide (TPR) repeat protein